MIDKQVILTVVWMIGSNAMLLVAGLVYSSWSGKTLDAGVAGLAGTCIGYLGGVLTSIRRNDAQHISPAESTPSETQPKEE